MVGQPTINVKEINYAQDSFVISVSSVVSFVSTLSVKILHGVQEFSDTNFTNDTNYIREIRAIRVRIFSGLSRLGGNSLCWQI